MCHRSRAYSHCSCLLPLRHVIDLGYLKHPLCIALHLCTPRIRVQVTFIMSLIQLELELVQESARVLEQIQPPQQNVHDALCDIYRSARQALERARAPPKKKRRIEQSSGSSEFEEESAYVVKIHSSFVLNVRTLRSDHH